LLPLGIIIHAGKSDEGRVSVIHRCDGLLDEIPALANLHDLPYLGSNVCTIHQRGIRKIVDGFSE